MGKLALEDEPLTRTGRLARCGKWVEPATVLGADERAHTHEILIAPWKLSPFRPDNHIHVSTRRSGPCGLVLRERAGVIKAQLRPEELGLIRRSLAEGAPSGSRTHTHTHFLTHKFPLPAEATHLERRRPSSLRGARRTSRRRSLSGDQLASDPPSRTSRQLELRSQFGGVRI